MNRKSLSTGIVCLTAAAGLAAFTAPTARHSAPPQSRAGARTYVAAADDLRPSLHPRRSAAQVKRATVARTSARLERTAAPAASTGRSYSTQASTVESAKGAQGGSSSTSSSPSTHTLQLLSVDLPAVDMSKNLSTHVVSLDTIGDQVGYSVKVSVDGYSAKSVAITGFDGSFLPSQHQELLNVPTIAIQEGLSISGALAYSDTGNICVTIDNGSATCTGINPLNVARLNPTLILDLNYKVEGISDKVHKEVGVKLGS
jgi:hypothetical protein